MGEPTTTLNHEAANRTATGPATHAAAPAKPAVTPTADSAEGRKLVRNLVALIVSREPGWAETWPCTARTCSTSGDRAIRRSKLSRWDVQVGMRSTILDDAKEDRAQFNRLLQDADVFFANKRPGFLKKHGLDAESLVRAEARIDSCNRRYAR